MFALSLHTESTDSMIMLVISIVLLIIRYKSWQQFWGHWDEEERDLWSAATATGCKESCIQLVVPNFGYNWALASTHSYVYKCVFYTPIPICTDSGWSSEILLSWDTDAAVIANTSYITYSQPLHSQFQVHNKQCNIYMIVIIVKVVTDTQLYLHSTNIVGWLSGYMWWSQQQQCWSKISAN